MSPISSSDLDEIIAATAPLWEQMRNQRLFLTGGTGFFGTWLLESFLHGNRLLALKAEVTVLTRNPQAFQQKAPHLAKDPALSLLSGDIRTFAFPPGNFLFLIHAATEASAFLTTNHPDQMLSTIVEGTGRVLKFAHQAHTRKLLFTSSGAVYGPQPPDLPNIPEDFPTHQTPLDAYAQGKLQAEHLCTRAATPSLEIKIARCFAFLGPHLPLDAHFAAGNFLADALAGRPIAISGDGTALRSYLYPTDLCIWLWTILFSAPTLRPYNVGSEHPVSIRDLAHTIAATSNPSLPIHIAHDPDPNIPPARYVPATTRAREELNLHQSVSLEDAIRRTLTWHQLKS